MASLQRYFPATEAAQIAWLSNYRIKLAAHNTTVDIDAPELASISSDILFYVWLLGQWNPAIQNDAKEATAYKKLIADAPASTTTIVTVPVATVVAAQPSETPPGVLKRLFNQVVRIKASAGYTESIGMDLQIIGPEDTAEHPVPVFKVIVEDGSGQQAARIKFTKYGHDGVYIESRVNGGAWEFLAIDTKTPYLDDEPLAVAHAPETREYRMRFWDSGDANGDWTDVAKVMVGG